MDRATADKIHGRIITGIVKELDDSGLGLEEQIMFTGDIFINILESLYMQCSLETNRAFNKRISNITLKFTGERLVQDEKTLSEIKERMELVNTLEFRNLALKHDYSKDVEKYGLSHKVKINGVYDEKQKDLIGAEGNMIGLYSLNPNTKEIERDDVCGIPVFEFPDHEAHVLSCDCQWSFILKK